MRTMKDSGIEWIGKIPVDWTLQRGKTIFAQRLTKGNQSEILLAATQKYGMLPQSEVEGVVQIKEDADLQQFRTVHKKDFVISLRSFQGGFEYSQYEGVCSPAYQVFYNTNPICHNYYRLLFKSDGFIQKMNSMTVGIREGKNIQYSDFANSLIPVPPINQQQRIADYLDRKCSQIDTIIARQQEVIEKLKAYRLSVITEAVTKGLNPDVHMKDSGVEWIGKIPEHWKIGKLCFFTVRIGDGLHGTPEFDDAGEYYFINGNNLGDTYITIRENTKSVSLDEYNKYFIALNENTLLISLNGTIGNVSQYHGEQIILGKSAGYIIVDSRRELTIDYLKFYLQSKSVKTLFELSFAGTTINNLSLETLRNLPVCIMTGEEQFHIAKFLEKKCARIDQVIQKKTLTIDKLNEYKKSLIYEVVTGKREV